MISETILPRHFTYLKLKSSVKTQEVKFGVFFSFCFVLLKPPHSQVVTEPKLKAKTQNIRVSNKERFTNQEGANQEDGKLNGASNSSCSLY